MKILFIISTLKSGGAERVCAVLANELCGSHDISLLKFDNDKPFYEIDERVKVLNLNVSNSGAFAAFKRRVGKILSIRNIIKTLNFDVVVSFLDSTNFLVIASSFGLKTRVIASEHTSYKTPKPWWVWCLRRVFYPKVWALSVLTKSDKDYYQKFVKNVKVIHNPNFSDENLSELKKENLVVFIGRLIPFKNCEMFLKVAYKLRDSGYKFMVIGDGLERERLQLLDKNLGSNVSFLGNVKDISQIYKKAKIILSCSRFEGLGNTLIEAIGFECVRIATRTSGAVELIDDKNDGILVDIDDENAMSAAVLSIINDENMRKNLVKNAKLKFKEFTPENIAKKWLEIMR